MSNPTVQIDSGGMHGFSSCCHASVTYHDDILCCKKCWKEVEEVFDDGHWLRPGEIFVFGSNLRGVHGKGAALYAVKYCGAVRGVFEGLQNRSYAIPTKDFDIRRSLKLSYIKQGVDRFITFATTKPDLQFFVTALGTGLAGYSHADIAPFFEAAPEATVRLPMEWREILARRKGGT